MKFLHKFCFLIGLAVALAVLACLSACRPGTEEAKPAQVHVTSAPSGAMVFINGVHEGHSPTTLMRVPSGKHLIILRKTGYCEARTTVVVDAGERIAVEMNMEPLTGSVLIHSQPSGATVEINNADYGKTPLLLSQMPFGHYRMLLHTPGYLSRTIEMTVADRTPQKINVNLLSDSARVTVSSHPPGAGVSIGGATRGTTPLVIEALPSGRHVMNISMRGYEPYKEEFEVQPGDSREIKTALTPLPGTLLIITRPEKARVYINNQHNGEAPVSIPDLPAGEYVVRVELRGYETMTKTNTVRFGDKSTIEFDLIKNSGEIMLSTEPPGVRVYLDGIDQGYTKEIRQEPISEQMQIDFIPHGQRQLQLTKQGYFDLVKTVEITPDRMFVLHEKLKLRPVPFVHNIIIRTGQGPEHTFRGIIREEYPDGRVLFEIDPGIFKEFTRKEIISIEPIKRE